MRKICRWSHTIERDFPKLFRTIFFQFPQLNPNKKMSPKVNKPLAPPFLYFWKDADCRLLLLQFLQVPKSNWSTTQVGNRKKNCRCPSHFIILAPQYNPKVRRFHVFNQTANFPYPDSPNSSCITPESFCSHDSRSFPFWAKSCAVELLPIFRFSACVLRSTSIGENEFEEQADVDIIENDRFLFDSCKDRSKFWTVDVPFKTRKDFFFRRHKIIQILPFFTRSRTK